MRITESQQRILESLCCERLSSNEDNFQMPFLKILIMTKKWYSRGSSGIIPDVINSNLIYYVKYCNKC